MTELDPSGLWVVRPSRQNDVLFVCEAKGYARVARMWAGRSLVGENAALAAAAPFMRRTLQEVFETIVPSTPAERAALRLTRAAIETSYLPGYAPEMRRIE